MAKTGKDNKNTVYFSKNLDEVIENSKKRGSLIREVLKIKKGKGAK